MAESLAGRCGEGHAPASRNQEIRDVVKTPL